MPELAFMSVVGAAATGFIVFVGWMVSRDQHDIAQRIHAVARAFGVQGKLQQQSRGPVLDGRLRDCLIRIVGLASTTRVVVVVPGLSPRVTVESAHRSPGAPAMRFPERAFNERLRAHGDASHLVGLLSPEVRAALARANAAVLGPHVELGEGTLRVDISGPPRPSELRAVAAHLERVLALLLALPTTTAGRLLARVEDREEAEEVRVRALRLALTRHAAAPETRAALEAARISGVAALEGLARAATSSEPLQGRLSLVGTGATDGALSEVGSAGALSDAEDQRTDP